VRGFYILIIISIIGFGIGIVDVYFNDKPNNGNTKMMQRTKLPFKSFIAGTGIVEPDSKNIVIGSIVSGLIKNVYVKSGDKVKKGDLLFSLDDREARDETALLKADKNVALARLQKAKHQFELVKKFKKATTIQDYEEKKDNVKTAMAFLKTLDEKLRIMKKKMTFFKIYAPIDGKILKSNLTVGSYFDKNNPENLLIMGNNNLNLRVSINEYDIWKFQENKKAVAFVRGHPELKTTLKYLYTVPYVSPKTNFTGVSTEKTDTRVLEVIYQLPKNIKFPIYVGEQLDVFIKTDN